MKTKKLLITTALVGALAIPTAVFAATSNAQAMKHFRGFLGIDITKLTDEQKTDVSNYSEKMADVQKEFINKMVENGSMTKEQGEIAINNIDNALETGTYSPGGMGKEFENRGKRRDFNGSKIDTSILTDEQKADLKSSFEKIATLQKELVKKQVSEGLITEVQSEKAIKKIDESLDNDNYLCGMEQYGFELYRIFGFTQSELTDEQMADLKDYSEKIADIHKEIISKEVEFGLLTEEQGYAASQKIGDMDSAKFQFGPRGGMERGRKGMMNGHGARGNFNKESDSTTSTAAPTI